jgi:hypothetical protein
VISWSDFRLVLVFGVGVGLGLGVGVGLVHISPVLMNFHWFGLVSTVEKI